MTDPRVTEVAANIARRGSGAHSSVDTLAEARKFVAEWDAAAAASASARQPMVKPVAGKVV